MNLKKIFGSLLVVLVAAFALTSCFNGGGQGGGGDDPQPAAEYIELDDYKAYIKKDLSDVVNVIKPQLTSDQLAAVETKLSTGLAAIDKSASVKEVMSVFEDAKKAIASQIELAEGIISFNDGDKKTYTDILGIIENYAIRNNMLGMTLFENGSYVMYNPRVTLGTENYIVGYGFGVLAEGAITADLESETVAAWKRYYHSYEASDPATANYLNDQGSQVGDLYGYFGASFYTNFMNETKDGYIWVPELAKADPVNAEGTTEASTTWSFPIRVGSELKYNTNSTIPSRAAFNGREVAPEDYITPFKLLLTQTNGLYRGSELANSTTGAIKGAKDYYDSTSEENVAAGRNKDFDETVGVKVYQGEDSQWYFQVEFTSAVTQFNARYYISSSLYMPIPQEFLDLVTVENYLGYNADKTETPVDNALSVGAYTLEKWDSQQQIVYKKNPYYVYADSKYAIAGIHLNILTAAQSDPEAGFNEFIAGKIDAAGIPETKLAEYKDDPRTRTTKGNSCFKINLNSTDAATWEYLFGENGTNAKTAKEDYWDVKPYLHNVHFAKALSLSLDRSSFAASKGYVGSVSYFSSNYMSDPENMISYNATEQHEAAIAGLVENTDGYGYNLELAREYFKVALVELEAQGALKPGTKENPTVLKIEAAWMYPQHETQYHNYVKQYFEAAFNDDSVCGGVYKLELEFWVGNDWSDVYYGKMIPGQFDIGFGSISGNALDPLDFFTVNSTNPDLNGGFCLNWGVNTNAAEETLLVYQGKRYSFDALLKAGLGVAVVTKGNDQAAFTSSFVPENDLKINADGTATATIHVQLALPDVSTFTVDALALCWYELYNATGSGYDEVEVTSLVVSDPDAKGNITITATIDADQVADFYGDMGFDVYYTIDLDGSESSGYFSVYGEFPRP